ncbi:hypothetical protein R9X47_10510 [Wukongibacter baidiensis]|uniref:hypothetical protein n=1 Tax=Wukongibacter baidiensis TaxID=1723361 RepID=UPI003D7F8526
MEQLLLSRLYQLLIIVIVLVFSGAVRVKNYKDEKGNKNFSKEKHVIYIALIIIAVLFASKSLIYTYLDYKVAESGNYPVITDIVEKTDTKSGRNCIVYINDKKIIFKVLGVHIYEGYMYKISYLPYSKMGVEYEGIGDAPKDFDDYFRRKFGNIYRTYILYSYSKKILTIQINDSTIILPQNSINGKYRRGIEFRQRDRNLSEIEDRMTWGQALLIYLLISKVN